MIRLTVILQKDEREAVIQLAQSDQRDRREQAALIIRRELQRLGLLPTDGQPLMAQPTQSEAQS